MSEHTKEPWKATKKFAQVYSGENFVMTAVSSSKIDFANARRIVACVNILSQFDTEFLETMPQNGLVFMAVQVAVLCEPKP